MYRQVMTAAALATLLATGCQKAADESKQEARKEAKEEARPATPAVDVAAEEKAIRDLSAGWMNYANAHDSASIGKLYTPDAITIYDGRVSKGADAIRANLEKDMADRPKQVINWTTNAVKVAASGDLAYETGDIYVDEDGAAGKKPATTGSFVTVWAKVDGEWHVVADAGTETVKKGE